MEKCHTGKVVSLTWHGPSYLIYQGFSRAHAVCTYPLPHNLAGDSRLPLNICQGSDMLGELWGCVSLTILPLVFFFQFWDFIYLFIYLFVILKDKYIVKSSQMTAFGADPPTVT